jgi:hypothetical protein
MVMEAVAPKLQYRTILAVAGILFTLCGTVVLIITGRPSLLILVGLICCVGGGIALIGSRPSNGSLKDGEVFRSIDADRHSKISLDAWR